VFRTDRFDRLEALIRERGDRLLATAVLLTGRRDAGEDLLQQALERVVRRWSHVRGDPEAYVFRTLYNLSVDRWRTLGRRKEIYGSEVVVAVGDHTGAVDLRDAMVRALQQLPARQRAVLVMRYFDQRSEAEMAAALRCSVGTVKSAASRGLARLRELSGADLETHPTSY
jgi:RNA polymerase sigma-70 factor (sigma-E family)